ncbi:hemerythrin domain-containing protein [Thiocystis violacea]|uniref:hemerythrin domain-containing protein n=1 Tax=Thiocystis violacea TaxID=13725 RepID=UPI00190781DF|nr:hemerythrin domain-containing protein [Thiocystis violacea]MBK1720676.1 hemerythrin [Thiocystis violacea]
MTSVITDSFTHDHHRCDRLLAAAETSLTLGDWSEIAPAAQALVAAMEQHFRLEEETLFPQLAQVFAVAANPIEVMTAEHAQMRALFEDLTAAVGTRDKDACVGILETLHFVGQQHNYKEETVLYPMADGALRERGEGIAACLPAQ